MSQVTILNAIPIRDKTAIDTTGLHVPPLDPAGFEAFEAGYALGLDGLPVVEPPRGYTPDQVLAYLFGHGAGIDAWHEAGWEAIERALAESEACLAREFGTFGMPANESD